MTNRRLYAYYIYIGRIIDGLGSIISITFRQFIAFENLQRSRILRQFNSCDIATLLFITITNS